jgi:DNA replication terminus site-binding protein
MDNITQVRATVQTLSAQLDKLTDMIYRANLQKAIVSQLPMVPAGAQLKMHEPVPVDNIEGEKAVIELCRHIQDFYAREGESTRVARRLPGFVHLQMNRDDIIELTELTESINRTKNEFRDCYQALNATAEVRHEVLHSVFPFMVTLNVTRQLMLFTDPIKSIHFNWVHKHSMKKCTHDEITQRLHNAKKHGQSNTVDAITFEQQVNEELDIMERLSGNERLLIRRPIKESPVANVSFLNLGRKVYSAHTPFIVANTPETYSEIASHALKSYEPSDHKTPDKYQLVLPRLHLYQVNE